MNKKFLFRANHQNNKSKVSNDKENDQSTSTAGSEDESSFDNTNNETIRIGKHAFVLTNEIQIPKVLTFLYYVSSNFNVSFANKTYACKMQYIKILFCILFTSFSYVSIEFFNILTSE